MSQPDNDSQRKTMAIRVDPEIHAELSLVAQLRGNTLADEHLQAVLNHIEKAREEADLAERAEEAIAEIEREAALKRDAINRLRRSKPAVATEASEPSSTEPPASTQKRTRRSQDPS
ncbi:hypothetical protein ACQPXH_23900 [Nocardia sp. CA-135953]|uniref:hypothetical protein n=1 Tax=Nocardia sp. CA-135953 TaxID=3239978 RepID=UPI003D985949